jgi:co-chaperonin GroES (HSP10)
MTFRAYADNVVLAFEPRETETASGLSIVHSGKSGAREHRTAKVVASGPGYWQTMGKVDKLGRYEKGFRRVFVPNTVKVGDRVIVDALAGQDYALDLNVPRHNKAQEFQELFGDRGEFRIVREEEILAVLVDEVAAE